jgi:hypothetical protein
MTLTLALGFAADKPQLELTDPELPLYVIRPNDRRVSVLTLDGTWHKPATFGKSYYVNVLFPNGKSYSTRVDENLQSIKVLKEAVENGVVVHRVVEDSLFRRGEVVCYIQDFQLRRNGLADGGKLTIVVSLGKGVTSAKDKAVVSNALEVKWPMDRKIARRPPHTRHADPEPVDAFVPPGEEPERERIPAPKPDDPGHGAK